MKINNKILSNESLLCQEINNTYTNCIFRELKLDTNIEFNNCQFINCTFIDCEINKNIIDCCTNFINTTFYNCDINIYTLCIIYINNYTPILFYNCKIYNIDIDGSRSFIAFYECDFDDVNNFHINARVSFINCVNNPKLYKNNKSFYGYKYTDKYLIILEIPKGVKVYESPSGKCRCSKAKILSILNTDGTYSGVKSCNSWYTSRFKYKVNEYVKPEYKFDNSCTECTDGIHFFKDIKDAYSFAKFNIWPKRRWV